MRRIAISLRLLGLRLNGAFLRRGLTGFPWFWPARPPGQPAMVEARRRVRQHFGVAHDPMRRKLAQAFVTLAWPLIVLLNVWQVWQKLGPDAGFSVKRVPGALWAAIRHNILPSEYCAYALWLPDRRMNIDSYLYSNEASRLFNLLNRPLEPNPIDDKLAFYSMCKVHALPTPAILAVFGSTGTLLDFESGMPPQRDLFVKASTGGGLGERLRWYGGDFQSNGGCRFKPKDLSGYLLHRARTQARTLVVQPVLSNHPDLRVHPNDALATARLVTGRSLDGEIIPIFSFILFGLADQITAHSNYVTLVDITNGRLMPAPSKGSPGMSLYHYRQFGADDACTLPDWDAALRHVKAAHQACADFVFVGWDVAFTPHGAMILEGNANWDGATYQTLRGQPLGHTRFSDILTTHFRRRAQPRRPEKKVFKRESIFEN
jgi:hypothetical protein